MLGLVGIAPPSEQNDEVRGLLRLVSNPELAKQLLEHQAAWKRNVRQEALITTCRLHCTDVLRVSAPEDGGCAATQQLHGQCRAPGSGTEYRDPDHAVIPLPGRRSLRHW